MTERSYDTAIFFDNLKSHVSRVGRACGGRINSVHVGGVDDPDIVPFTNNQFRDYWERDEFRNNSYLDHTRRLSPKGDLFDSMSGLKRQDIDTLYKWIDDIRRSKQRAAIFLDWDRTVTIFEGVVVGFTRNKDVAFLDLFPNVSIEDTLQYICGGRERLRAIRDVLQRAVDSGIDVYILTNNTGCSYRYFKELVDGLLQGRGRIGIVCAGDAPYYGNKVKAIRRFFRNCTMSLQRTPSYTRRKRSANLRRTLGGRKRK
jgi:hypothetical protein